MRCANPMKIPPRILIITGMHRSGTSLVAHYLKECGLYIGDNLFNQRKGNPLGHFEDLEFLYFHKRMLRENGIDKFPTSDSGLPIHLNGPNRIEGIQMVARRMERRQWGWKDPRTTLFLEFWSGILKNARYLFIFRHPSEVAQSLVRRGTDADILEMPVIGLKAWRVYNNQILQFWMNHQDDAVVWDIQDLVHDPQLAVRYLNANFDIELEHLAFDRVFRKNALHSRLHDNERRLKIRYLPEYLRCILLYKRLLSISEPISRGALPWWALGARLKSLEL